MYPNFFLKFHTVYQLLLNGSIDTVEKERTEPILIPNLLEIKNVLWDLGPNATLNQLHWLFLISPDQKIQLAETSCTPISGHYFSNLNTKKFEDLLAEDSREVWKKLQQNLADNYYLYDFVTLTMISREKLSLPTYCYAFRVPNSDTILLNATVQLYQLEHVASANQTDDVCRNGAATYRELVAYMATNISVPLPQIKRLALILKTNEYNLKFILRHYYGTTLHTLYLDERLKKSRELVLQSRLKITEVALECGFVSQKYFSRVFKRRFGITPSAMRQRLLER